MSGLSMESVDAVEEGIDLTGAVDVDEGEISISLDDELPEEVEFAAPARPAEEAVPEPDEEEVEIKLEASSADIPIRIEDEEEPEEEPVFREAAGTAPLTPLKEDEEFEVETDQEVEEAPSFEEEFSVDLGEQEQAAIGVAVSVPEPEPEEVFSPSFDAEDAPFGGEEPEFQIEIGEPEPMEAMGISGSFEKVREIEEMDLSDLSNIAIDDEEAVGIEDEIEEPAPPPVSQATPPVSKAPAAAAPPPAAIREQAPKPKPAAAKSPVAAELEEVDEYIALGLYEDARDTLRELLKTHPGDADILSKIEELGFSSEQIQKEAKKEPTRLLKTPSAGLPVPEPPPSRKREPEPVPVFDGLEAEDLSDEFEALVELDEAQPEPVAAPAAPSTSSASSASSASSEGEFIDLASELSEEIFGTHSAAEEEEPEPEGPLTDPGLDQIFREFRKGVEKQLGAEDYDTRYNLGIAYKEMGLLDEAIAEFQLAAKDELRALECCSMLGLCFMEKGMPDIAIKWFSKGLVIPGRRVEEYHGLRYDLAQAFEAAGQPERALELYMEIFRENVRFRDVQERVKELQAARK
jgi:tetratricopeptide (TPR) repeat protein